MKNRQRNHHFAIINASDIYCLRGDWVCALLDSSVLTSVFEPPPPYITVKYNNTERQNNFESVSGWPAAVPTRPFWNVVGFYCYIRFCVMHAVRSSVSELNRYNVYYVNEYKQNFQ